MTDLFGFEKKNVIPKLSNLKLTEEAFHEFSKILTESLQENDVEEKTISLISDRIFEIKNIVLHPTLIPPSEDEIILKIKHEIIDQIPDYLSLLLMKSILNFEKKNYELSIQFLYDCLKQMLCVEFLKKKHIPYSESSSLLEIAEIVQNHFSSFNDDIFYSIKCISEIHDNPFFFTESTESAFNYSLPIFNCYLSYRFENIHTIEEKVVSDVSSVVKQERIQYLSTVPKSITNSIGIEFVLIPEGEFVMGCIEKNNDTDPNETPPHKVRITKPFYMAKFPTTQGEWKQLMQNNPSFFNKLGNRAPVEKVSWNQVNLFIQALNDKEGYSSWNGYRLPTEAEWEYACRAGTLTRFYFGNNFQQLDEHAWILSNSSRTSHIVGLKIPNPWGLYDMLGNVKEWCQDYYQSDYYNGSPLNDPKGPKTGLSRVLRGGSWHTLDRKIKPSSRWEYPPGASTSFIGFRLIKIL